MHGMACASSHHARSFAFERSSRTMHAMFFVMVAAVIHQSSAFSIAPSVPGLSLRGSQATSSVTRPLTSSMPFGSPIRSPSRSTASSVKMQDVEGGKGLFETMADGHKICYDFIPGATPTVVYLPALNQTRHGTKSFALQVWAKRNGQGFLTSDYYGCGRSGGEYIDGTISKWTEDTVHMLTEVVKGPVVLVGAGVGGWIAMHCAMRVPDQVKGIVGVAADPDFTTDIVLPELDAETKQKIRDTGMADIVWGLNQYTLSQKLIDDAEEMLLLKGGPKSVPITCPVRLLQGLGDEEIPPNRALKISDALESDDVVITYAKFGDHVLDDEEDFRRMTNDVGELCSKFYEFDLSSPTSG